MLQLNPVRFAIHKERDADEGPALQVAFATSDLAAVNEHFGSATRFGIYRVAADRADLLGAVKFDAVEHDGNEGKLPAKISALTGCAAVFCQAAGGSAVKKLLAAGIQPIKLEPGATISQTLSWLRGEIDHPSASWVVKALRPAERRDDPGRFDAMEAEGWQG